MERREDENLIRLEILPYAEDVIRRARTPMTR